MAKNVQEEIQLSELWDEVFARKWVVIITGFLAGIIGVYIAVTLPEQFKAKVTLIPNQNSEGLSDVGGQLGGLAGLAGINLGSPSSVDKTAITIKVLQSPSFIIDFIKKHEIEIPLMAAKSFDRVRNRLELDPEKFDAEAGKWVREATPIRTSEPTPVELYERFTESFEVIHDKKEGFIELTIEFYSPQMTVTWLSLLLDDINEKIREEEIEELQANIAYLEKALENTTNASMHTTFYSIIEEQTKSLMLAESRKEFALKIVSPAMLPEKRSKPNKVLIVIAMGVLGGVLSLSYVIVRYFTRKG